MHRPESEFMNSRPSKILKLIDMFVDEKKAESAAINNVGYESKYFKPEVKKVTSLREMEGWRSGV